MTYSDKAQKIKDLYTNKYKDASDENIAKGIQDWMDKENGTKGYLTGLSPSTNITKLAQMVGECGQCTKPEGNCSIASVLRNIGSVEMLIEMVSKDKYNSVGEKAIALIEKNYEPYVLLHEFTKRICSGTWHTPLIKKETEQ